MNTPIGHYMISFYGKRAVAFSGWSALAGDKSLVTNGLGEIAMVGNFEIGIRITIRRAKMITFEPKSLFNFRFGLGEFS